MWHIHVKYYTNEEIYLGLKNISLIDGCGVYIGEDFIQSDPYIAHLRYQVFLKLKYINNGFL